MWQPYLCSVQDSTIAGGDATAQQANFIHWSLAVHFGQRNVRHHGVLREGAGSHEVEHLLAFASKAGGLVRHQPLALGDSGKEKRKNVMTCSWASTETFSTEKNDRFIHIQYQ